VIFVTVFEICIFFLECFEIVSGALEFLFEPLNALFKFLDVLSLVIRAVLHGHGRCSRSVVAPPHSIVIRSHGAAFSQSTLSELLATLSFNF